MHAGWVLLYFVVGCALLAWACFPAWRQLVRGFGLRCVQWCERRWRAWLAGRPGLAWLAWGGVVLLAPLAIVLAWSQAGSRHLEGFDDRLAPANEQVSQLLQGEHLVPPPPLPPDAFITAEVAEVRPLLSTADRRWEQMDPAFVQRLLMVFKIMKEQHGYEMALLEGYRSPERQAMLADKGSHVTMAGAWQSYHQFGLASDCAFYREGKLVISEKDPWAMRGYQLYGQVAEQVGLTWGGRWQMMDLGHVEWRKPGVQQAMQAMHRMTAR